MLKKTESVFAGQTAFTGPKPFSKKDRSRFLQALDEMIVKTQKKHGIS